MRFWIPLLIAAAIAGSFWLAVADSAPPPPIKMEKQIKRLQGNVASLTAQIIELQRVDQTAAEAESNLEARVSALEAKAGP
jgi:hypothetical protein